MIETAESSYKLQINFKMHCYTKWLWTHYGFFTRIIYNESKFEGYLLIACMNRRNDNSEKTPVITWTSDWCFTTDLKTVKCLLFKIWCNVRDIYTLIHFMRNSVSLCTLLVRNQKVILFILRTNFSEPFKLKKNYAHVADIKYFWKL